ncbi:MAG: hypothetical protein LBS19_04220 [Clostridiales bacterium]|jgi:hypothetical protein|nr:hypothetical protein [Clostridiales bacterium]
MKRKIKAHPAEQFCRTLLERNPKMLEYAERFTLFRASIPLSRLVPDWCALPVHIVGYLIAGTNDIKAIMDVLKQNYVVDLTAALLWTRHKMIYRFDSTLADTLMAQPLDGNIPSEILDYLPYPCVYVDYPIALDDDNFIGFFAWLDWGTKDNNKILRLQLLKADGKTELMWLPVTGGTLQDSILHTMNQPSSEVGNRTYTAEEIRNAPITKNISGCINLLLYLCSEKPDLQSKTERQPRFRRDKYGNPTLAATWEVGIRIGAALRKTAEQADGNETPLDIEIEQNDSTGQSLRSSSSPRPHMRRAHWHSFWTGKHNSPERKLKLQWLPPIAVMVDSNEFPTVVRPVKE